MTGRDKRTHKYDWEVLGYSDEDFKYAVYIDNATVYRNHREEQRIELSISNQSDPMETIDFVTLAELDEFIERLGKARATFKELLEKQA